MKWLKTSGKIGQIQRSKIKAYVMAKEKEKQKNITLKEY